MITEAKTERVFDWWKTATKAEKEQVLDILFIQTQLAEKEFFSLPPHIRFVLYTKWDKKLETRAHESLPKPDKNAKYKI